MNVFFVRTNGLDEIAILNGTRWLVRQCKNEKKEGVIAAAQQQSIDNVLRKLGVSNTNINNFFRNGCIQIDEAAIRLLTIGNPIPEEHDGIILAVHPRRELLTTFDDWPNIASILVIPWIMSYCQEWLRNHNAIEVRL